MSTALLQELNQEVRRLYIAGSDLAVGDFRLKRLLPQFQQLGERAPIFKRLGEGIAELIEPTDPSAHSAQQLQELGLLLGSVLYTQGKTTPDGELLPIQTRPTSLSTKASYRRLAAVEEALTTTGSGRYEIVKEAFKDGLFQDLRLLQLAIGAVNDPYVEIADFAMNELLPSYGPAIVPLLIEQFDPAGGKADTRKLRVIGQVGGAEVLDLVFQVSETGADDVRVTAIGLLAGYEQYEAALIDLSKDKKKPIREAAYLALAKSESAVVLERLYEAFFSKDMELAAEAIDRCSSSELKERLVRDFSRDLMTVTAELKEDKKRAEKSWERVYCYLEALGDTRTNYLASWSSSQVEALDEVYMYVLKNYVLFMSLGWGRLIDRAASFLEEIDSEAVLALLDDLEQQNAIYVAHAFRASFRQLEPAQLYDKYANYLRMKITKASSERKKQLLSTIEHFVMKRQYKSYPTLWNNSSESSMSLLTMQLIATEQLAEQWDQRWLSLFIEQKELGLVSAFARPDHVVAEELLLHALQNNRVFRNDTAELLFQGLERLACSAETRREALMTALEDKQNKNCYAFDGYVLEQLYQLPATYRDRVEAVLPQYNYTAGEQLRYVLRNM
ncbi:HEAT repeat domain-containing protein [Paenibacillus sp. 481]|uniref:HEAT repeat domain-containing protein n=1 Tax=Paenibacillus sp. 481 TaxID=2835869 RepID=UPI001E290D06|nr:HEAT repeat domain-containing protein [Paenibacillus sp. 481]UHA73663.1 HEAT repeat domain-containing protein [Paenibacillus sp. 481]